ncbi:putative DNA-binding domain-containing protein [Pseudomonas guariconensis]|uniref:HvfC family RiPP maturation protein n=1 Tax=Pseudomonas TaxID=286 RepID=UPI001CE3E959|nr:MULTISPECIES: putative DNA-binding domain-containing protein [Pseudomonas]MCO7640057.1 putative DNA-binding domain-containing protein [Pseudomonas sp. S 311-6]MCO7514518.1 putative DNA-binding domain-containing protein [Pseudomonas putida]MCO7565482.1 putative DNA-binding domain-containing protein [Pseudomonas mosselii]MCO7595652.1 putative DNA-binding domain-containing protein [Pseudomonas guariconensis]MCO7604571.1 putative DNA-binding domain-containing protein [Pseudomonas guariconensis]
MNETLRQQQFTLARHLRDPAANPPPPGIEARRLKVYRELFYNAIEGLLAGSFPVMRQTLGEARWHARVRDFHAHYRSQTPLFTEVAEVFIDYLHGIEADAPWQLELAHYEWLEAQLYLSDAEDPEHRPEGDLLEGEPLLSCVARVLAYRWPVERIGPGYQPAEPPDTPTLLLVYRDADLQVRFARLTPLAYQLLAGLQGSGRERLQALGGEEIQRQGLALLEALRGQGIIVGTR